jgi:serine/threonine protein kinase/tetratricopeptide (TPR) repeat protein
MNPEQWTRISELFEAALAHPVDERGDFLDCACSSDEDVKRRVEAMLAADKETDLLIDHPAYEALDSVLPSTFSFDESESFSGDTIGDYRLIRELGRGGMGTVYLAYDTRLERYAALKLLPSRFNSPERVRRLQREARSASALNHPHIITIYDFGQENGRDFIASEFVEGRRLRDYVGTRELTLNQILEITIQVTSALETAHAAGIIHRDIKPENIMLRPDGYAKVLDFGLAKLTETDFGSDETPGNDTAVTSAFETRTGILLGTVNYMSPEQVRGQKLDGRTDLFSLGVVLYELVTGHRPFRGETFHHTMVAITDTEPRPLTDYAQNSPAPLQDIISRVLAKDRDGRYQSARALLSELETLQAELVANARVERIESGRLDAERLSGQTPPLIAGRVSVSVKPMPKQKRRQLASAVAFALVIAAVAFFLIRGIGLRRPAYTERDTILLADFVNTTGDADFDDTLKQGLTVQLEQSPFINIYPEERARETLGLMERPRDAAITREIGREICQRRGINVLITGTIAKLGRNYVITLEALNSQSGDAVAHQQTEVEGKEQVLKGLGRAASSMREKLGESLSSIQKFDVPIDQATTASLEAFKSFTAGVALRRKGDYAQSVTHFKRAVELDNQFAMAYAQLGSSYRDLRNFALGNQYLQRSYELRERVSERERLEIAASYFRYITGELERRVETTSLVTQTYPQDPYGHHIHGNSLMIAGQYERAAEAYRAALKLDNDYSLPRANLALALIGLNRFDEARDEIQKSTSRGLDFAAFHNRLFLIAFLNNDEQSMQRQIEWFKGRPDEAQMREIQARTLAFAGRRREANQSFAEAAGLAEARNLTTDKARILSNASGISAMFGMTSAAQNEADQLLALLKKKGIGPEEFQPSMMQQLDAPPLAWTLALCGDAAGAQSLTADVPTKFPLDTIRNAVVLPLVQATLELRRGPGMSDRAIQLLEPSRQYEAALNFRPTWIRGQLYLQSKNGELAAAEFQKIIDHRGWDVLSPLWPLAHLGRARAAVLQGDSVKARQAYEEFFRLWKDADADLPVLIEARREYAKLKS